MNSLNVMTQLTSFIASCARQACLLVMKTMQGWHTTTCEGCLVTFCPVQPTFPHAVLSCPYNVGSATQDTSTGQTIAQHRTKMGPCDALRQNPHNAVSLMGHAQGVVTMWTPNMSTPVIKMLTHRVRCLPHTCRLYRLTYRMISCLLAHLTWLLAVKVAG